MFLAILKNDKFLDVPDLCEMVIRNEVQFWKKYVEGRTAKVLHQMVGKMLETKGEPELVLTSSQQDLDLLVEYTLWSSLREESQPIEKLIETFKKNDKILKMLFKSILNSNFLKSNNSLFITFNWHKYFSSLALEVIQEEIEEWTGVKPLNEMVIRALGDFLKQS